jgi:hypothetical protein
VGVDVVGPQAPQQLAQAAAERRHLRVRFPPPTVLPSFCPLLSWLFFPPKNFFLPAEHFSFFAHSLAAAATALLLPYAGPGALPWTRAFSPVSRASSSAPIHASLSVQPEPESQPNEAEAATEEVKTETAPAIYAAARLAYLREVCCAHETGCCSTRCRERTHREGRLRRPRRAREAAADEGGRIWRRPPRWGATTASCAARRTASRGCSRWGAVQVASS